MSSRSIDVHGPFALYSNEQAALDLTPTEDHQFVRRVVAQRSSQPDVIVMLLDCGDIVEYSGEHAKIVRAIIDPDEDCGKLFSLCMQCKANWAPSRILTPFATSCAACTREVTDNTNFVRSHNDGLDTLTHLGCWMKLLFDPEPKAEGEAS